MAAVGLNPSFDGTCAPVVVELFTAWPGAVVDPKVQSKNLHFY